MKTIKECPEIVKAYNESVSAQLKANGNSGWATPQSVAVIEAISDAAYGSDEGFDVIRPLVTELCNASAFRTKLEKLPETHALHVKPTGRVRGGVKLAMGLLQS